MSKDTSDNPGFFIMFISPSFIKFIVLFAFFIFTCSFDGATGNNILSK